MNGSNKCDSMCKRMFEFPVEAGFHQRFAFSLYLFAMIMDNLMANIQEVHACKRSRNLLVRQESEQ